MFGAWERGVCADNNEGVNGFKFALQPAEAPTSRRKNTNFYGVSQGHWLRQDNETCDLGGAREGSLTPHGNS